MTTAQNPFVAFVAAVQMKFTTWAVRTFAKMENPGLKGKELDALAKSTGNRYDAFRHALWSIKLFRALGIKDATLVLQNHEKDANNTMPEMIQDVLNNKTALAAAQNPANAQLSDFNLARQLLNQGQLIESADPTFANDLSKINQAVNFVYGSH